MHTHEKNIIVIYHGNCADGFGAAWAINKYFGDLKAIEFHPGVYQTPPPDVTDKVVILVDFSYKSDTLKKMLQTAYSILLIDHHKTAIQDIRENMEPWQVCDMSGWTGVVDWDRYGENLFQDFCENAGARVYTYFDITRSGAMLAWNFFHPYKPAPKLICHIQDRDLWRFLLPKTREIQACVYSHPYDFAVWDFLSEMDTNYLAREGEAIERKHFKDIDELLSVCKREMTIGGHLVPVASLPYTLSSDAGHKMAKGKPFAACYWDTKETRVFSLRSQDDGLDVSEIARQYGGGGHRNAAGFSVPRDHELAVS